jgi:hypothetical protein
LLKDRDLVRLRPVIRSLLLSMAALALAAPAAGASVADSAVPFYDAAAGVYSTDVPELMCGSEDAVAIF